LDRDIFAEIKANPHWMPLDFINYLVTRYHAADLLGRFPAGIGQ
jgi:hypothetical protein